MKNGWEGVAFSTLRPHTIVVFSSSLFTWTILVKPYPYTLRQPETPSLKTFKDGLEVKSEKKQTNKLIKPAWIQLNLKNNQNWSLNLPVWALFFLSCLHRNHRGVEGEQTLKSGARTRSQHGKRRGAGTSNNVIPSGRPNPLLFFLVTNIRKQHRIPPTTALRETLTKGQGRTETYGTRNLLKSSVIYSCKCSNSSV